MRATAGIRFNGASVIDVLGTDTPRFDYNPANAEFKGLLIEPSATNNLARARAISTSPWSVVSATITGGQSGPLGDANSFLVAGVAGNRTDQTITATPNVANTASMYFKAGTLSTPRLRLDNGGPVWEVVFDLVAMTGSNAGTGTATNIMVVPAANGGFRCSFQYTPTTATSIFRAYPNGTGNVIMDGAQHEAGTVASSLIVTGASAGTRAADVLTLTLPYVLNNVTFTFDDGSTQTISGVSSPYVVPTNLNRPWIKSINVVSA